MHPFLVSARVPVGVFLARRRYGFQENICGGGVRLLTLLLVTLTTISITTIKPNNATAADDGYHVYAVMGTSIWSGPNNPDDHGVQDISDGKTFVSVGYINGNDYNEPCATDSQGGIWKAQYPQTGISIKEVKLVKAANTVKCPANTANSSNFLPTSTPSNFPYWTTGMEWYADRSVAHHGSASPYSVDRTGTIWTEIYSEEIPTPVPYPEIDFQQIAATGPTDGLALGKPRVQTPQTVVTQMPTTGAPEGLTLFGLAGLSVAGLGLILLRRRV